MFKRSQKQVTDSTEMHKLAAKLRNGIQNKKLKKVSKRTK